MFVCDEVQTGFAPHRPLLRDRALRRRARPDHGRQVDRDGAPALRRARQGRDHGRARRRRRRRHVCRQPGRAGGRARRPRRDRGGGARRARRPRSARRCATRMESWQARWPQIGDVRGLGSMLAIELVESDGKTPATELASRVVEEAARARAAAPEGGRRRNCIRVLVPARHLDASSTKRSTSGKTPSRPRFGADDRGSAHRRMVGEVLSDRYELEELVGTGGMSSVYRAHDRLLDRKVALKVLHEQYARRRRSTSSDSGARRGRSPPSRIRTSSPSSTAASTAAGSSSSSSTSPART